tara:strand:+ start:1830 stop:2291 length:462 start_codon:yes stop_codon:yes gene_type:complete
MKNNLIKAIISFIILSIIVIAVSSYLVLENKLIGPAFLFLGVISLFFLRFLNIKIKSVYPDIIFGAIDNGVLIFAAVLGGIYAGVTGAIIGGAAGNTITDGIGGLFEGHIAENQRKYKIDNLRTALSTMLGKMTGCLFGAGAGLILVWLISLV